MGGTTSKQVFQGIVGTLLEKDVDSSDHAFWDELWKTVLTVEEVFQLITAEDVRKIIATHPENMRTLFTQAVAQLYQVVETPYPIYFSQALNCAWILARVLPFLLESDNKIIKELLWNRRFVKGAAENAKNEEGEDTRESEPLAVILVNTVFHLLFLPDFTIEDPNVEFNESDINTPEFKAALMWAPGVGCSEKTVTSSTQFDTNRMDILRLMIAAFSDSLYQNADTYDSCASMWLEVATSADAPYAEIVFYSLMNTVLGYDPIGWGVPYGNLVATDTAKLVMEHSIQALIILLDYGHPVKLVNPNGPAPATPGSAEANPVPFVYSTDTDAQGFNVFRRLMASIDAPDQLNFIYRGFVRLLNNVHQAESVYLPYSITRIGIEQELLVLLWKCLEEIPKFMPYVLKQCDVTALLVPICYFMLEGRKDPAKVGLMYLCTFTLLKLSGERNFGVSLNKAYQLQLPVDVPLFTGNHADLLIIVLHKLIVSGLEKLSPLYNCFLTIICNVSPYCKSLCTMSSVKLVNLLQLFVSPKFLYASDANHVYVGMLLETFNNLIQYQYEGNGNVIYAIIRRKEIFEGLSNLTLPAAIKDAKELADTKAAAAAAAAGTSSKAAAVAANNSSSSSSGSNSSSSSAAPASAPAAGAAEGGSKQLGSKKSSEGDMDKCAECAPTELISTQSVERRVDATEGEIDAPKQSASGAASSSEEPQQAQQQQQQQQQAAASAHHHHRFVPTEAWLQAVKAELPLNTINRLLKHLGPQLDELTAQNVGADETKVIEFLRSTTMVGLLPVPHPIVIRKYQPNKYTCLWFTAFQWGVIFMHNQTLPLFDGKHVKLFMVQTGSA